MKTKAKILHYIVTKRGKPCASYCVVNRQRAGILLPSVCAETFSRRRTANAAINRTIACRAQLHASLVRDWLIEKHEQIRELLTDGDFAIIPVRDSGRN